MQANDRNEIDRGKSNIIHSGSRFLFRLWETTRAERACPNKHELTIASLSSVLPHVAVLQSANGKAWNFRLAGSDVCDIFRTKLTGLPFLAQFDAFEQSVVSKVLALAAERLQPGLIRLRLMAQDSAGLPVEMLILPVRDLAAGRILLYCGIFAFPTPQVLADGHWKRWELASARMIWTEHGAGDRLLEQVGYKSPSLRVIQGGRT